jgi:Periplasmic copper-binding protein (NosD)
VGVSCNSVGCAISQTSLRNNTTAIAAFLAFGKISLNDIRGNDIGFRTDFNPDPGFAHELAANLFTANKSAVVVNDIGSANVHDNLFVANGVGFTVPSPDFTFTARLVRNVFTRNGDAVFVSSAGATLKQNTAVRNRGWGIHAPGAIDLGGNVAHGNGRNPQCVGVACS